MLLLPLVLLSLLPPRKQRLAMLDHGAKGRNASARSDENQRPRLEPDFFVFLQGNCIRR